jgi:hypothetical protein
MTTMLVSFLGELSQDYFCGQIILLPGIKWGTVRSGLLDSNPDHWTAILHVITAWQSSIGLPSNNPLHDSCFKGTVHTKNDWFLIDLFPYGTDGPSNIFLISGHYSPLEPPQSGQNARRPSPVNSQFPPMPEYEAQPAWIKSNFYSEAGVSFRDRFCAVRISF